MDRLAGIGLLASSLAHEINNPLDAIGGLTYLLQRERQSPRPGQPGEFHPQLPTEPYVTLSSHTARASIWALPAPRDFCSSSLVSQLTAVFTFDAPPLRS